MREKHDTEGGGTFSREKRNGPAVSLEDDSWKERVGGASRNERSNKGESRR